MPSRQVTLGITFATALVGAALLTALGPLVAADAHGAPAPAPAAGTLVVTVEATGGDAVFAFNATGGGLPAGFDVTTTNGTGSVTFTNVTGNETLTLAQVVPAGWKLADSECSQGAPGNFSVPATGTVTCTFRDTRLATLVVTKSTRGGDGTFTFDAAGGGIPSTFDMTTVNGSAQVAFTGLDPDAELNVMERVPGGWTLANASCTAGSPADVTLTPGGTTTCTFENARLNTLTVRVAVRGGDGTFTFVTDGEGGLPASFDVTTTNGTGTITLDDLATDRNHSLALTLPDGWKRGDASCDEGAPGNMTVGAGDAVACTFHVTRLATLRVDVVARGGDAMFTFNATGGSLPDPFAVTTANGTGAVTFTHVDPDVNHSVHAVMPEGWRLVSASCAAGSPGNVTLTPGGTTTCTFENTRLAELHGVVYHDADRDGIRDSVHEEGGLANRTVYVDADGNGALDPAEDRTLTDANGAYRFTGLAPGHYHVRTVLPAAWARTAPADGEHEVTVGNGTVIVGLDFGHHRVHKHDEDEHAGDGARGARGLGFWKNWDAHGTFNASVLDAWMGAIAADSAWLLPHGYANDTSGMVSLLRDSTKGCNKRFGHDACAERKFLAHYLVLRLNVQAGLVAWEDVEDAVSEVEAKAGSALTRHDYLRLKGLVEGAVGGH